MVIAIIAILAGMLLPALGQVKGTAHSIECLNREKQMYHVFLNYANAYDDYAFAYLYFNKYWGDLLVSSGSFGNMQPGLWVNKYPDLMKCPAFTSVKQITSQLNNGSYEYCVTRTVSRPWSQIVGFQKPGKLSNAKHPSAVGWYGDSRGGYNFGRSAAEFDRLLRFSHNGKVNFLYVDGHSEAKKSDELPLSTKPGYLDDPFWHPWD